jgi:hypothetical protein
LRESIQVLTAGAKGVFLKVETGLLSEVSFKSVWFRETGLWETGETGSGAKKEVNCRINCRLRLSFEASIHSPLRIASVEKCLNLFLFYRLTPFLACFHERLASKMLRTALEPSLWRLASWNAVGYGCLISDSPLHGCLIFDGETYFHIFYTNIFQTFHPDW